MDLRRNSNFVNEGTFAIGTGCNICVEETATLKIGSGFINSDSKIYCSNNIVIGNNVIISENVVIRDSDSHYIIENGKENENSKPIYISDNVWIGHGAVILKGVKIGKTQLLLQHLL